MKKIDITTYEQIYDMVMGNPLSPIAAEFVMSKLLSECIGRLQFEVPFMKIYVNDIIMALPKHQIVTTMDNLNKYHFTIKYTLKRGRRRIDGRRHNIRYTEYTDRIYGREEVKKHMIPFLDIKLQRTEGKKILTEWYRKPTNSNRILHFRSAHLSHQKTIIVKNFIRKIKQYVIQN